MKKGLLVFLSTVLFCLTPALSEELNADLGEVDGWGNVQCGFVMQGLESGRDLNKKLIEYGLSEWAWGYLSAKNKAEAVNQRRKMPARSTSLAFEIVNLCKAEPTSETLIHVVVDKYYYSLEQSRPQDNPS